MYEPIIKNLLVFFLNYGVVWCGSNDNERDIFSTWIRFIFDMFSPGLFICWCMNPCDVAKSRIMNQQLQMQMVF